jgi:predicted permease
VEAALDSRVLVFTLAVSLLSGIAFGLVPALSASSPDVAPTLKDESFVPDARRPRLNARHALVVAQVGLSLALLVAAGLFVRSLRALQAVRTGLDVARLATAPLAVNILRYTRVQGQAFYRVVLERVEGVPGVEAATLARIPSLEGGGRVSSLHLEGREGGEDSFRSEGGGVTAEGRDTVASNVVGPRYLETLGIALLSGRSLDARDAEGAALAVVVNETFGRLHFPGPRDAALGARISLDGPTGPWRTVVGVAADSKYRALTEEPTPMVYVPLAQQHETGMVLYVRASGDPGALLPAIRREIRSLEPHLPLPGLRTMPDAVVGALYVPRTGALLLAAFGGVALLLAAVGVYGVTAFSVAQRTREIGVRMALGARAGDVLALVLGNGLRLVAAGVALGLALALAAARALEAFLFGVRGTDPATFAAVAALLGAAALVACFIPARRAMRLDPVRALQYR